MTIGKPKKVFRKRQKTSAQNNIVVNTTQPVLGSAQALTKSATYPMPGPAFGSPPLRPARVSPTREAGYPGLHVYGGYVHEEFISDLQGRRGVQVYEDMRRNDPVVGAMLLVAEQLIHNATVIVDESRDNPDAQESQMAADLVRTSIHDMGHTWTDTLSEILTFLAFGWSYCAVWHKKREGYHRNDFESSRYTDGKYGWAGISLRGQSTMLRWAIDKQGRANGMVQQGPPKWEGVLIPNTNAAHFRTRTEKDNPEGLSILRNAWRPWYIKKHLEEVEGIGLERDLAGLPILITPEGLDIWNTKNPDAAATLERANNIVRLARIDKYGGIVLPFGWDFKLLTTPGQRAQNSDTVISRWDQRIAVTLLADMLLIGHERVGSFALVQSKTRLFSSALESYAARIAGVFNRQLIPRLMNLNGIAQEYWPTMKFGPVDAPALTELAMYIKTLSEVGVNVDEAMGLYLRHIANLPDPKKGDTAVKTQEEKLQEQKEQMEMMQEFQPDPGDKPDGANSDKPKDTGGKQSGGGGNPRGGNQGGQPPSSSKMRKTKDGILVKDDKMLRYSIGVD